MTILTALIIAITAAPIGCIMIWKRMAYFGDALSHTALLGISLGLLFGFNVQLGGLLICILFACSLVWLRNRKNLPIDTLLGLLAHGGLALGIILLSITNTKQQQDEHHLLETYLFGTLEQVTYSQCLITLVASLLIIYTLKRYWQNIILMTLNEELAHAEGVNTLKIHYIIMFTISIFVALSIKTAGVLFITSLLIIPAAAARQISKTPKEMVLYTAIISSISIMLSIPLAGHNIGLGAVTVIISLIFFIIICLVSYFQSNFKKRSPK